VTQVERDREGVLGALAKALEAKDGERRVRTPEGARLYDQPIGSIIRSKPDLPGRARTPTRTSTPDRDETVPGPRYAVADIPAGLDGTDLVDAITDALGQEQNTGPGNRPDQYDTNPRTGRPYLRVGGIQTQVGKDADNRPILYDVTAIPGKEAYGRGGEGVTVLAGNPHQNLSYPHVRVAGSDRPLPYVFRVISEEDWQSVVATGVMRSDGRMNLADEGTVTSDDSTGVYYMTRGGNRVVRIRVEPEEDWRVDIDGYVKTHTPIPIDRIDLISPPLDYDPDAASRGEPNLVLADDRAAVPGLDKLTPVQLAGIQALRDHPVNRKLGNAFRRRGRSLFLVGGSVRDALAGQPDFADLDYTTDADPEEIKEIVDHLGPMWGIGEAFGTIGVQVDGLKTEITTFRTERYDEESRKPVVEFGDNILDDLRRRDLTMNAMALTMATDGTHRVGELVDPHDGAGDLAAGLLRTPDDPAKSMSEDPLRQLRVVRFAARRGAVPDPALKTAIVGLADRLGIVAAERKTEELRKIFKGGGGVTAAAAEMANELTVTKHLFGDLDVSGPTIDALRRLPHTADVRADPTTILGLLAARTTGTDPARAMVAMKLSNDEARPAIAAARVARQLANPTASPTDRIDARRIVRDNAPDTVTRALAIHDAIHPESASPLRAEVVRVAQVEADQVRAKLPVDGNDLRQLGLTGPEIGQALGRIMDAFLADPNLSKAAALAIARQSGTDTEPGPDRDPDPDAIGSDPETKAARGVVGRVAEWVERLHPRDRRGRFARSSSSRRAAEINAGSPALTVTPAQTADTDTADTPLDEMDRRLRFLTAPITPAFRAKVEAAKPWGDGPIFDAEGLEQFHRDWRRMDGSPGPKALESEQQLRDLGKILDAEISRRLKAAGVAKPLTEKELDALRARRMEIFDRWDEEKWKLIEPTAQEMFGQRWSELEPDQLSAVVEKVHADRPDLAAMRAEVADLLNQLVDGSLGTTHQASYSIAAQAVLSQLRPMGGEVDAQAVIVGPKLARAQAEAEIESGPNSGTIPYQWRHHGPWDARAPRPVNIDRVAMKDYNRLHPNLQKQVRDAIKQLESGGAAVEPKTRQLAGTYGVRISKEGRMLVYPHIDGTWHIYAVIPHHDYREAERRMVPADEPSTGARVPAVPARVPGSGRRPPPPPQRPGQGQVRPRPQRPAPSQSFRGDGGGTGGRTRPWVPASEIPIVGTIDDDVVAKEAVNAAAGRYPTDWIEASNRAKGFLISQSEDGRGYYREIRDPDTVDELALGHDLTEHRVAVHELAHRLERIVPAIRPAEWAFLWRRTSKTETDYHAPDTPEAEALQEQIRQLGHRQRDLRYVIQGAEERLSYVTIAATVQRQKERAEEARAELAAVDADLKEAQKQLRAMSQKAVYLSQREWAAPLKDLKSGGAYGEKEVARPDKFVEPYIGKDYGDTPGSSYEVMSMGMEGLFTGSIELWRDPEHRNLVLGLLAGA
jgi:tRNA nucleotidyltransferase/poly(A) polymerase